METNMSFNAPIMSTPIDAGPVRTGVPTTNFSPEVPVVAPQQEICCDNINIYAESISCSTSDDPAKAVFDIVLSVSWNAQNHEGYKTAKILKSIAFDKASLVEQTNTQKISVLETKEVKKDNGQLLKTMRELAGVPNKGNFI